MMFYLLTESFSYSLIDFFNTYGASAVYPALTQPGAQYDRRKNQTPKIKGLLVFVGRETQDSGKQGVCKE